MDKYKEKCDTIGLKYKQKYDKLLSLVNGYENQNIAVSNEQEKNMKQLSEIISNTKELLSENEFTNLRNEQNNIMKEFYHLENVKNDNPYSNDALDFTNNSGIVDDSLETKDSQKDSQKEESTSTVDKIKSFFNLDSFSTIGKKTNVSEEVRQDQRIDTNTNVSEEVKKDLEQNDRKNNNSTEIQTKIEEQRNNTLNSSQNHSIHNHQIQHQMQTIPYPPQPQPCYPNKPNFVGLPSIQIVNVESGCRSRRTVSKKSKKRTKVVKEEKLIKTPTKRRRKIKKTGPKCHKSDYVPTFKDKSNNHKIFNN